MKFRSMTFRTYVHATEDQQKVMQALGFLLGEVEVTERRMAGFYGNPITVLEGKMEKDKEMKKFWQGLEDARPGIVKKLALTLDERMDEEGSFYVRFDKQRAYLGEYKLAEGGDVIETKWRVAVYPSKRESALRELKEYLDSLSRKGSEEE